jgi:hypothetical protein
VNIAELWEGLAQEHASYGRLNDEIALDVFAMQATDLGEDEKEMVHAAKSILLIASLLNPKLYLAATAAKAWMTWGFHLSAKELLRMTLDYYLTDYLTLSCDVSSEGISAGGFINIHSGRLMLPEGIPSQVYGSLKLVCAEHPHLSAECCFRPRTYRWACVV